MTRSMDFQSVLRKSSSLVDPLCRSAVALGDEDEDEDLGDRVNVMLKGGSMRLVGLMNFASKILFRC